jgi:predicted nucleotide-binding protein
MKPLIFISHSSKDKDIARRLSGDLWTLGYEPWLDEWEISVGECILTSIEKSIDQAAFVVVLLSKHADELDKLREPLAGLKPQFFTLEYGFRR